MPGVLVGEMTSQVNNGPPKQIKIKNYGHIIEELSLIYFLRYNRNSNLNSHTRIF